MEYTYNPTTDGICSISEFARHDCLTCPKKGMCEFVVEEHKKEKSEKNDKQWEATRKQFQKERTK
jgi:hypothetical protein